MRKSLPDYNWITPNQYNDMHTTLSSGYKGLIGDAAKNKQGDDFLSQIIPIIMSSKAYKNHGVIIIWWDASESDGPKIIKVEWEHGGYGRAGSHC
jgi:hypothetical protein